MRLYRLLMRNFAWKVTSIVVATILYTTVRLDVIEKSQKQERGRGPMVTFVFDEVPVILLKKATETNRFLLDPALVQVKVKANAAVLEKMDASEIKVFADLVQRPSTNSFRVVLDLEVSDELAVEYVRPQEVGVSVLE